MYRLMIHDEKTMGGFILPTQHIGMHYYEKYESRNKPMPFAVVMGTEPVTPLLASAAVPAGVNEADVLGRLRLPARWGFGVVDGRIRVKDESLIPRH